MTTPAQQKVIDLLVPGAQRAAHDYPGTYASVCIAQAILESGWGKSTLAAEHHNWFGVKWFGPKGGPFPEHVTGTVELDTWEYPTGRPAYKTRALFRTYADPLGSCLDWAANLKATTAYAKAGAWEATDAEDFARRIGPVYTGGNADYADTVIQIMRQHNLANYDLEIPMTRTLRGFTLNEESYWTFLALEELAFLEGWCKKTLDIYQGIGYSTKSGGTHAPPGGAIDFWQSANPAALLRAARNGGMPGWYRTENQGFARHIHAIVKGLPGRPYNYQITALLNGYDGLGASGRGGRDDGPRDGVAWRDWASGLEWLRARIKAKRQENEPRVMAAVSQRDPDFWNPWRAVEAWDNANPADATLTGLSDVDLRERFIAHGFTFYNKGSLHEDMRFTLADFAGSLAMADIERNPDEVAWDLLQRVVAEPARDVTWVELRPVFAAAHAGGAFGAWGEQRTRHSVRAVQAGLNHLSGGNYLAEDGIYGSATRQAVSNYQVQYRGAAAGTASADGVPGVNDFLHLVNYCTAKTGRTHRGRFLY